VTREHSRGNLPVNLAPHADEFLSWISRHAPFCAVSLCFGIVFPRSSLHAVDRNLKGDQTILATTAIND